jgi:hypothetical protein
MSVPVALHLIRFATVWTFPRVVYQLAVSITVPAQYRRSGNLLSQRRHAHPAGLFHNSNVLIMLPVLRV